MSLPDPTTDPHDCAGDAAAYALGALEPREACLFSAHVENCVVCRDELTTFQAVARTLPMGAPQHRMPRGLRRRVISDFRQPSSLAARSRRASGGRRWRRALPRPALAVGAAAMLAVATVGGLSRGTTGAPPTRVLDAQVFGSRAVAQLRLAGDHGELVVQNLPPPAWGHIYEVWLKRSGQAPAPTNALFSVTSAGNGEVQVPGSLSHVGQLMVTQEPAGGSAVPTSAPVIVATLT